MNWAIPIYNRMLILIYIVGKGPISKPRLSEVDTAEMEPNARLGGESHS